MMPSTSGSSTAAPCGNSLSYPTSTFYFSAASNISLTGGTLDRDPPALPRYIPPAPFTANISAQERARRERQRALEAQFLPEVPAWLYASAPLRVLEAPAAEVPREPFRPIARPGLSGKRTRRSQRAHNRRAA